jgi:hypothetical protein
MRGGEYALKGGIHMRHFEKITRIEMVVILLER